MYIYNSIQIFKWKLIKKEKKKNVKDKWYIHLALIQNLNTATDVKSMQRLIFIVEKFISNISNIFILLHLHSFECISIR